MDIAAVMVNHNTSAFAELAIRSLYVHNPGVDVTLTVYDNDSTDDRTGMLAAAATYGAEVVPSGFSIDTPNNSHGDVLTRFVLDHVRSQAEQLLFLDADICFTRPGTLALLQAALEQDRDVFGVGPRMSWDGETPMPTQLSANPGIYVNRLHPCCALIRNTETFRSVVDHLGLSSARLVHADHEVFLDTFELMTMVMRTHRLRHRVADEALIMHAFAVSYPDESSAMLRQKEQRRDKWLTHMRQRA